MPLFYRKPPNCRKLGSSILKCLLSPDNVANGLIAAEGKLAAGFGLK